LLGIVCGGEQIYTGPLLLPGRCIMRFCLAGLMLMPVALARAGADAPDALYQDALKLLKEQRSILADIKDSKAAEKARPQLIDLDKRFARVTEKMTDLSNDPKKRKRLGELERQHGKEMMALFQEINGQVKQIVRLPGIRAALKGVAQVDAWSGVQTIDVAVNSYRINEGAYPQTLQELAAEVPGGRRALLDVKSLIDPWGRAYVYEPNTLDPLTRRPLIYSQGPRPGDPAGRIRNWPAPPRK
jgi:hypothetical protein